MGIALSKGGLGVRRSVQSEGYGRARRPQLHFREPRGHCEAALRNTGTAS